MLKTRGVMIIGIAVIFSLSLIALAQADTLSITTYYPSPYGSYKELIARKMKIGTNYSTATINDNILIVEGKVGIATTDVSQNYKLNVNGNISATNYYKGGVILDPVSALNPTYNYIPIFGNPDPEKLGNSYMSQSSNRITASSNLTVNNDLRIRGAVRMADGRKPIRAFAFSGSDGWVWYSTGLGTSSFYCFIGGISLIDGDIEEHDDGTIMDIRCRSDWGIWYCGGDFRSHHDHEEVQVKVLCIDTQLIDDYSTG